ncbi:DUF2971 domain-containing protein [Natranaerovirga pectinivora]|uniref:DUF2971 domain-containing protein n=1 Tax=Natranaerovirga pectinivora TaxID=682400 RepID=UPI001404D481|nr:DUF2971 domain-containing protein [Natranaerovirga pectinivora]
MRRWKDIYEQYMSFSENPYFEDTFGHSVHHYTDIHALMSILRNRKLWLSDSDFLNDRNEVKYTLDLISNICYKEFDFNSREMNKIFDYVSRPTWNGQQVFIMSFSEQDDLLPLWSYYSQVDGYNISFNPPELISASRQNLDVDYKSNREVHKVSALDRVKINLSKVIYNEEQQTEIITKITKLMKKAVIDYRQGLLSGYMINKLLIEYAGILRFYSLNFKQIHFEPEQETRLTVLLEDKNLLKQYLNHRSSNGIVIPYIELNFSVDQFNSVVKKIMIGPKNNLDVSEKGLKSFLYHEDYKESIQITKSLIPLRF